MVVALPTAKMRATHNKTIALKTLSQLLVATKPITLSCPSTFEYIDDETVTEGSDHPTERLDLVGQTVSLFTYCPDGSNSNNRVQSFIEG